MGCPSLRGDSIRLQLDFSTPTGKENVCDVNAQGRANGYMVSMFSLPTAALKGGSLAVYTCPGSSNKGDGVAEPVAYGQCDGGLCFTILTQQLTGSVPKINECLCDYSAGRAR